SLCVFISNAPPSSSTSSLSLHDALPICSGRPRRRRSAFTPPRNVRLRDVEGRPLTPPAADDRASETHREGGERLQKVLARAGFRSEEHTSELQSRFDIVCRLLLEEKT